MLPSDTVFPADRSTIANCTGPNGLNTGARTDMFGWAGEGALNAWVKHEHPAKPGYTPLEVFTP